MFYSFSLYLLKIQGIVFDRRSLKLFESILPGQFMRNLVVKVYISQHIITSFRGVLAVETTSQTI